MQPINKDSQPGDIVKVIQTDGNEVVVEVKQNQELPNGFRSIISVAVTEP